MSWYARFAELVRGRTGIELPTSSAQLKAFIQARFGALGHAGEHSYLSYIQGLESEDPEWQKVVHACTNRLTHFYRDRNQLLALEQLIREVASTRAPEQGVRIWCAGASTGEEPYTVSILCHQLGVRSQVVGSDLNSSALESAQRGEYSPWSLRRAPPRALSEHFHLGANGRYQVKPRIRSPVRWCQHNLVLEPPLRPRGFAEWDIVLCRNVLIYYSQGTVRAILSALASALSEGGALMLGASETIVGLGLPLRLEMVSGRVVYRPDRHEPPAPTSNLERMRGPEEVESTPNRSPRQQRKVGIAAPAPLAPDATPRYVDLEPQVLEWVSEGRVHPAILCLADFSRANPRDTLAGLGLGHLYLLNEDWERAGECYEAVSETAPLLAEAHYFRGVVERARNRLKPALDAFRQAVFLEPTFWAATYLLGATARRLGRERRCRSEWSRTLELIDSGHTELPFLTHPVLHTRFVHSIDLVREVCKVPTSSDPSDLPSTPT